MAKTATVTLGGVEYAVHPFNLDELQEVGEVLGDGKSVTGATSIRILKIALRRATPPVPDAGTLEVGGLSEVSDATKVILHLAGLGADPKAAAPAKG